MVGRAAAILSPKRRTFPPPDAAHAVHAWLETDEWFYEQAPGKWKRIPPDIIHDEHDLTMPAEIRRGGVLFIYNGLETCFWPPLEEL
jgi:hypothetical protein